MPFVKGVIPWNKGKHHSKKTKNKISITKQGSIPWNKGLTKEIDTRLNYDRPTKFKKGHPAPKTTFKKGHIPYNKGTARKIFKSTQGYIFVYKPKHPFCNKQYYIKRARLVMEKMLNRYLKSREVVHHINGIKDDDRPKNLQLFKSNSEHRHFDNRWKHHFPTFHNKS